MFKNNPWAWHKKTYQQCLLVRSFAFYSSKWTVMVGEMDMCNKNANQISLPSHWSVSVHWPFLSTCPSGHTQVGVQSVEQDGGDS